MIPPDNSHQYNRTSYGDEFYDAEPERSADSLLPEIPILQTKLETIKIHLTAESTDSNIADKRAFAVSLGCQEAKEGMNPLLSPNRYDAYSSSKTPTILTSS
jgi:hypothetical protein